MSAPLWFLLFTGGQLTFVFAAGVTSLLTYRRGAAARLVRRGKDLNGAAAFAFDLYLAVRLTWCGCLTHAAARGLPHDRALRFLFWCSALRSTTILVFVLTGTLLPALALLAIAGLFFPRALGPRALSPGALFLVREPRGRQALGEVLIDSARETAEMWREYGLVLVVIAAVGAAWAGALDVPPVPLVCLAFALLGLLARVDLVAALPLVVAAWLCGFPAAAVASFALACEAHSVRTRRLFSSYLRDASARRYGWLVRGLALAFALALSLL